VVRPHSQASRVPLLEVSVQPVSAYIFLGRKVNSDRQRGRFEALTLESPTSCTSGGGFAIEIYSIAVQTGASPAVAPVLK
jgi:hypothetical protein